MVDMQELIARLEEAEAGSRELDREIGEITRAPMGNAGDVVGLGYAHFTTSIDAALALAERVLPDARVTINTGSGWARLLTKDGRYDYGFFASARAATPALALCIAILKAKAQGEGG